MTTTSATPILAMGCRWLLDLGELDETAADQMRRRWSRCVALAHDPSAVVHDPAEVVVRPVPAQRAGEMREGVSGPPSPDPVLVPYADERIDKLPYDLSRALTRRGIERLRGTALLLHAAALTDHDGRGVVLVAASGTGKSTASVRLGRHLGYSTDESVVLTWAGEVAGLAPYPKPPSMIERPRDQDPSSTAGLDPVRKDETSPDDLGLRSTHPAPTAVALISLRRSSDVTRPRLVEVDLLDQLQALLPETSSIYLLPDGLDQLARAATLAGAPVRLEYAEIEDCVDLVRTLLADGSATAERPTWQHLPPPPHARLSTQVATTDDAETSVDAGVTVRRLPWTDAIAHDDRVMVLLWDQPVVLAGVGALIWHACGEPRSVRELTSRAIEQLGDHPDAEQLVLDAVRHLADHHVVQIEGAR